MKHVCAFIILLASTSFLTGCQTTGSSNSGYENSPALSPNTTPTSRIPSPGNIRATNQMQSSTMAPPSMN